MWINDKLVDDGYRSIDMILIHEVDILELRIEIMCIIPAVFFVLLKL